VTVRLLLVGTVFWLALILPLETAIGLSVLIVFPSVTVNFDGVPTAGAIVCLIILVPLRKLLRRLETEHDESKRRLERP
jgi:membrane protein implicated in regulation of membrane protease activity